MTSTPTDNGNPKVKIIIIDDDPASVEVLAKGLKAYKWAQLTATAPTVEEGRALIDELRPDIVFLDIEFNGETGLDLAATLKGRMEKGIKVVFYTSYRKYLIQALRLEAFDFLLKPFDSHDLALIMNRWMIERERDARHPETTDTLPPLPGKTPLAITTITNDRLILAPARIVYFKFDSERKIWEVVLDNLKRVILKKQTTSDTILSYGSDFVRTHKAYIINVRYIAMLSGNSVVLVPPYDKLDEIKISKTFRHELLERFYDL